MCTGRYGRQTDVSALAISADYHLVLNSDVRFNPDVLPRLIAVMNARKKIGQLQPRLVYPDGSRQPAVRMLPTPLDVFGRRFLPMAMTTASPPSMTATQELVVPKSIPMTLDMMFVLLIY